MGIRKELLDILACPRCKGPLKPAKGEDGLICEKCRLLYEIKDDIPIMLSEKARSLPEP
ncbi:MAG: Trm112 family protein [Syntrophobacterales bacterium]|nr:Trm112 family protein [Syntrophobacterales bacterium]